MYELLFQAWVEKCITVTPLLCGLIFFLPINELTVTVVNDVFSAAIPKSAIFAIGLKT